MGHSRDRETLGPALTTSPSRRPPNVDARPTSLVRGERVETDSSRMQAAGDRLAAVLAGREEPPAFRFEPQAE